MRLLLCFGSGAVGPTAAGATGRAVLLGDALAPQDGTGPGPSPTHSLLEYRKLARYEIWSGHLAQRKHGLCWRDLHTVSVGHLSSDMMYLLPCGKRT